MDPQIHSPLSTAPTTVSHLHPLLLSNLQLPSIAQPSSLFNLLQLLLPFPFPTLCFASSSVLDKINAKLGRK